MSRPSLGRSSTPLTAWSARARTSGSRALRRSGSVGSFRRTSRGLTWEGGDPEVGADRPSTAPMSSRRIAGRGGPGARRRDMRAADRFAALDRGMRWLQGRDSSPWRGIWPRPVLGRRARTSRPRQLDWLKGEHLWSGRSKASETGTPRTTSRRVQPARRLSLAWRPAPPVWLPALSLAHVSARSRSGSWRACAGQWSWSGRRRQAGRQGRQAVQEGERASRSADERGPSRAQAGRGGRAGHHLVRRRWPAREQSRGPAAAVRVVVRGSREAARGRAAAHRAGQRRNGTSTTMPSSIPVRSPRARMS